jgi:hypothetical protein
MGLPFSPQPKPELRKRIKGRNDRIEAKVEQQVQALVAARDGECRLQGQGFGVCGGASEWAHLEDKRRAKTRGMPPEVRHTTADTAMLCTIHHRRYDASELGAKYLTPEKADSRMSWWDGLTEYVEAA